MSDLVLALDEQALLQEWLAPDTQMLTIVIPPDVDQDRLWRQLEVCCKANKRVEVIRAQLRPLLGKMLIAIQDLPTFYESRGYQTYEEFLDKVIDGRFGLSRSVAY